MDNTGDATFRIEGTGDVKHDFRCRDTIDRLICCKCGALASEVSKLYQTQWVFNDPPTVRKGKGE